MISATTENILFLREFDELRSDILGVQPELIVERNQFKDGLYEYANKSDVLFHFSPINRVGINPQYRYSTPIGVYGYVASEIYPKIARGEEFFGHNRKFCHVLKITTSNVLYLQKFKFSQAGSKLEKLFDKHNPEPEFGFRERLKMLADTKDPKYPVRSEGDLLWKLLYYIASVYQFRVSRSMNIPTKRSTIFMNTILRELGYEVIIDDGGTIHNLQTTQAVCLTNKSFKVVKVVEQFGSHVQ